MLENLSENEKQVLNLFVRAEKDNNFNLSSNMSKYDADNKTLISLVNKGYINATINYGKMGGFEIIYDYKINGHLLSNELLEFFNI